MQGKDPRVCIVWNVQCKSVKEVWFCVYKVDKDRGKEL